MSDLKIYSKGDSYLTKGQDVVEKEVEWIWPGWILRNKLGILAADGGSGKSTLLYDIGARISAGLLFPDGAHSETGKVLYITSEDDAADTIKPRFIAAGGNPDNLLILDSSKIHLNFSSKSEGVEYLKGFMQHNTDIKLIVIDPIDAYCGEANTHIASVVKKIMGPINAFASQYNVGIVGILHFYKVTMSKVKLDNMISGSKAWVNSARLVLSAFSDPEDYERRYLGVIKSNSTKVEGVITYELYEKDQQLRVNYIRIDPNLRLQSVADRLFPTNGKEKGNSQVAFNINLNEIIRNFKKEGKELRSAEIQAEMKKRHAWKGSKTLYSQLLKESPYSSVKSGKHFILVKDPEKNKKQENEKNS